VLTAGPTPSTAVDWDAASTRGASGVDAVLGTVAAQLNRWETWDLAARRRRATDEVRCLVRGA